MLETKTALNQSERKNVVRLFMKEKKKKKHCKSKEMKCV